MRHNQTPTGEVGTWLMPAKCARAVKETMANE